MKTPTDIRKIKMFFSGYSKATVKTFTEIVTAVIQVRSTSLYKCKDKMKQVSQKKKTQADSHYKKLLRFFALHGMEKFCDRLFMFLFHLMGSDANLLVMDRSNWKRGKKNINLLTLGILCQHCFIPLVWKQMDKRGNSNFCERRFLMQRFAKLWTKLGKSIQNMTLVADREFIGPRWLNYLHEQGVFFVFRLRENMRLGEIESGNKKNAICAVMPRKLNASALIVCRYK
jgi:hypothetical protein